MKHVYKLMMVAVLGGLFVAATAAAQVPQVRMDGPVLKLSRHLAAHARTQAVAPFLLTAYTVEVYEEGTWTEFESGERIYDNQGHLVEEQITGLDLFSFPPAQAQWRVSYTYGGNGLLTEVLVEKEDQGSFMPLTRSIYAYDGTTLRSITRESHDDVSGTFVPSSRTTYVAYQGNIAVETVEETHDGSNWVNDTRETIVEEGGNVVFTEQTWGGSAWVNDSRTILEDITLADLDATVLDAAFLTQGELGQGFFFSTLALLYARFDPNVWYRGLTTGLEQTWDGSAWVDDSRTTITRDAQDRVVELLDETWDGTAWVNESRLTFSYDAAGRVATWDTETWDGTAWALDLHQTHTYDSDDNVTMILQEVPGEGESALDPATRISYTWTDLAVNTETGPEPVAFGFSLDGPNPFADQTALRFTLEAPAHADVRVYDLLGREVTALVQGPLPAGTHQVAVDGTGLPAGLYLVRLQIEGRSATRLITRLR